MDCKVARAHLDAYVDHELEPTPALELDQHFAACTDCSTELDVRHLLKGAVARTRTPHVPEGLRSRVVSALDKADGTAARSSRVWTSVLPVAAVMLLGVVGTWYQGVRSSTTPKLGTDAGLVSADDLPVEMLRDIVARHTDPLPAELTSTRPEQLMAWSRDRVAFRVRSVEWSEPSVRLLGARVSHIGDRQAVKLYYGVGDSRLTTVVFQAPAALHQMLVDDHEGQRLGVRRERIGQRVVSYQNVRGYTVPLIEHDGVVYAFTGDIGQRQLLHMVASAHLP